VSISENLDRVVRVDRRGGWVGKRVGQRKGT
jgi:hypothetical protein